MSVLTISQNEKKKFQMVFEQMSPLIRQMDTRKMEIFGINFNEFEMVKGSLGDRDRTDLHLPGTGIWVWSYLT